MHDHKPAWAKEDLNIGGHGPAVECCKEDEFGRLWVSNDKYASRVNFCPFCGYKAKEQAPNAS